MTVLWLIAIGLVCGAFVVMVCLVSRGTRKSVLQGMEAAARLQGYNGAPLTQEEPKKQPFAELQNTT